MKWMIALTLTGSTMLGSAAIDNAAVVPAVTETETTNVEIYGDVFPTNEEYLAIKEKAHKAAVEERRKEKMSNAIKSVLNRVGKTPYVLSGDSPSGWDCSGLVMWMYSKLGIELPHSATAQLYVGKRTKHPEPGDIVVWGGGYHSGIYLGHGKTVNALNPNLDTAITDVDYLGGGVTYIRVY